MTVSVIGLVVLNIPVDFLQTRIELSLEMSTSIPWTILHLQPVTKKGK